MKNIKNKKIIKSLSLVFLGVFIINMMPIKSKAADISFAITPSKIYDECIGVGESKSFDFDIANMSKDESAILNVEISTSIENAIGGEIKDNNNIVSLEKSQYSLQPDTIEKVPISINIPNDFSKGGYIIYINFIQYAEGQVNKNAIRVPMYIYVGQTVEYENIQANYSVINESLEYENVEETTITKELFKNFIKLLNPLNIKDVFSDIKYTPVYAYKNKYGDCYYDVNNDIYTYLKDVSTTRKKTTNYKYVQYQKDWLKEKIAKTVGDTEGLKIYLENGEVVTIKGESETTQYITEQLTYIAEKNKNIDLEYLMDNLKVLRNITFKKKYPIYAAEIKNESEIPITLKGTYSFIKDNSETIEENSLTAITLKKDETATYKQRIATDLENGKYLFNGTISAKDLNNQISGTIESNDKNRNIMFIFCGLFTFLYAGFGLFIVIKIARFVICKTKNKQKKDIS